MLDRKYILENLEAVKENCRNRNMQVDVDRFAQLEALRREKQRLSEDLNREANAVSKSIGQAKTPEEREERKERGRAVREQAAALKAELDRIEAELDTVWRAIPNMAHPDAPIGDDDTCNTTRDYGKTPVPTYDFTPLDHVELAEKLDLIDFEGGARVAGSGFYFLKNEAVLLELALQQYAVNTLMRAGFTPVTTPDMAKNDILQGTGYIPRGNETQIYSIENTQLSMIATAEITIGGLMAGRVIEAERLPLRLCGISHCFRTEAGAAGRASRGLYRVHQFTKIEMFAFTLPQQSEAMHLELLGLERQIFDGLGTIWKPGCPAGTNTETSPARRTAPTTRHAVWVRVTASREKREPISSTP